MLTRAPIPLPEKRSGTPWLLAASVGVLAMVALAHAGSLHDGFVGFDDEKYVTANETVKAGLTADGVAWAFSLEGRRSYFHPLTWLSLMLDVELFGTGPRGFHLVNVLLHALNAVLLLLLLWRTTLRPWPSLATSLLWAVHPLTVEAVSWIVERKAVLSTAFALGALHLHVSNARRPSPWRIAGSTALLALGLLAKPAVVVVPVLMLLLDVWPLGRTRSDSGPRPRVRELVLEKVPAVAVAIAVVAVGVVSLRVAYAAEAPRELALGNRVAVAFAAVAQYVSSAVWPHGLAVLHPVPRAVPWGRAAAGALLALGGTSAAIAGARRWLPGLVFWGWFLAAVSPYLGLYRAGLWAEWAERFAYVPLMGLAALVAFGAADLARRFRALGPPAVIAAVATLGAEVAATRAQVETWRDPLTLFASSASAEPGSALLRTWHGTALVGAGRGVEGEAEYRAALALEDEPLAHASLGSYLMRKGRYAEAEAHLAAAVRLLPDMPELLYNYAETLRAAGQMERARPVYRRFLEMAPVRYDAERRRAAAYAGS